MFYKLSHSSKCLVRVIPLVEGALPMATCSVLFPVSPESLGLRHPYPEVMSALLKHGYSKVIFTNSV
jgi:hypothetical protein